MPKNITLSLPDELASEMARLAEVNWSQVARESIENYVRLRQKPELAEVVTKLKKQKGEEYARGVEYAREFAQSYGYSDVDQIVREYNKLYWKMVEEEYQEGLQEGYVDSRNEVQISEDNENNLMADVLKKKYPGLATSGGAYLQGFRKTLSEIHDLLEK